MDKLQCFVIFKSEMMQGRMDGMIDLGKEIFLRWRFFCGQVPHGIDPKKDKHMRRN